MSDDSRPPLVDATFVERPNRFVVRARLTDGEEVHAHLGDPGRLRELLLPGAHLRLRAAAPGAKRRTAYTTALVRTSGRPGIWVSVETGRANRLARELLESGRVRGFGRDWTLRPEVRRGGSRFDFLLRRDDRRAWCEVKQVTWSEDGVARFPDAPTARGRRHVRELIEAVRAGDDALLLFVAARADARRVAPFRTIDPEFADLLRRAKDAGVALRAARFRLDADAGATWTGSIPVRV